TRWPRDWSSDVCSSDLVYNGALFHLGNFTRDADDNSRMHQRLPAMGLVDEVIEHSLSDFEVGDNTVFHRPDGHDVAGSTAKHFRSEERRVGKECSVSGA